MDAGLQSAAQRFWQEEHGFIVSMEMILTTIILVFGMIAGLQILRDAVVQEIVDLANAVGALGGGPYTPVTVTVGVAPVPEP
ncbi:MAG: hypothetical protein JNM18_12575 [Planctomycetaceae bacterium]|nr:hypothetical protein [Planctomycetaceae bacterium]